MTRSTCAALPRLVLVLLLGWGCADASLISGTTSERSDPVHPPAVPDTLDLVLALDGSPAPPQGLGGILLTLTGPAPVTVLATHPDHVVYTHEVADTALRVMLLARGLAGGTILRVPIADSTDAPLYRAVVEELTQRDNRPWDPSVYSLSLTR